MVMDRRKTLREYAKRRAESAMDAYCRRHLGISLTEFCELSEEEWQELFISVEVANFRRELDEFT
jgi:hypothetical protein